MRAPDKVIIKEETNHRPGSNVLCVALCVWNDPGCEVRIKIVRLRDRKSRICRWPREMINNNCVYTFRMHSREGTELVEKAALDAAAAAGVL